MPAAPRNRRFELVVTAEDGAPAKVTVRMAELALLHRMRLHRADVTTAGAFGTTIRSMARKRLVARIAHWHPVPIYRATALGEAALDAYRAWLQAHANKEARRAARAAKDTSCTTIKLARSAA